MWRINWQFWQASKSKTKLFFWEQPTITKWFVISEKYRQININNRSDTSATCVKNAVLIACLMLYLLFSAGHCNSFRCGGGLLYLSNHQFVRAVPGITLVGRKLKNHFWIDRITTSTSRIWSAWNYSNQLLRWKNQPNTNSNKNFWKGGHQELTFCSILPMIFFDQTSTCMF